jgi:hypothetical protein
MNTSRKFAVTAMVLFAVSFFLPAYGDGRGYLCFWECWKLLVGHDRGNFGGWLYYSGFVVSNAAFLTLGLGLCTTGNGRLFRSVVSLILLLHTLSWFFVNIRNLPELKVGYYVWLLAYGLLFAAHLIKTPR